MQPERKLDSYSTWLEREGIPVHTGFAIQDIRNVELGPWERLGGNGAYIRLLGSEDLSNMYVCEIPPGKSLEPEVHLFEAVCYVLDGHGCTEFWRSGEPRRMVEWQRNSLFALPLNGWHRFINLSNEPARFMAIRNAPLIINLFQSVDFVFGERYAFNDRYHAGADYFSPDPRPAVKPYGEVVYENNFIPAVRPG